MAACEHQTRVCSTLSLCNHSFFQPFVTLWVGVSLDSCSLSKSEFDANHKWSWSVTWFLAGPCNPPFLASSDPPSPFPLLAKVLKLLAKSTMSSQLVALCLAFSSSPSPLAQLSPPFTTPCCIWPICKRYLSKNPWLRGYNLCLAYLAGVAIVGHSGTFHGILNVHVANSGTSGHSEDEEQNGFLLGQCRRR